MKCLKYVFFFFFDCTVRNSATLVLNKKVQMKCLMFKFVFCYQTNLSAKPLLEEKKRVQIGCFICKCFLFFSDQNDKNSRVILSNIHYTLHYTHYSTPASSLSHSPWRCLVTLMDRKPCTNMRKEKQKQRESDWERENNLLTAHSLSHMMWKRTWVVSQSL